MEIDEGGTVRRDAIAESTDFLFLFGQAWLWLITQPTGLSDADGDGDAQTDTADKKDVDKPKRWSPLLHILRGEIHELMSTLGRLRERLEQDESGQGHTRDLSTLPPIFASTRQAASTLIPRFKESDDKVLRDIIIDTVWRELHFTAALKKTSTGKETLMYLDFMRLSNPPGDFWQRIGRPVASVDALWSLRGLESVTENNEIMCHRAAILTTPLFYLPPGGFYNERLTQRLLSHVEPAYSQAVLGWIKEANGPNWDCFQDYILPLLSESRINNFTHLVLAYAAARWPDYFGCDCSDAGPREALTQALLKRDIAPIHFAAALGLSQLMTDIFICGFAEPNHRSQTVGSPMFCALYGDEIFLWRTTLRQRQNQVSIPDVDYDNPRIGTILRLLRSGATTLPSAAWQMTPVMSISSLCFFAALEAQHIQLWNQFLEAGLVIDKALVTYIRGINVDQDDFNKTLLLSMLLTALMDHTLRRSNIVDEDDLILETQGAVALCLSRNDLGFEQYYNDSYAGSESSFDSTAAEFQSIRLRHADDDGYRALLRCTIIDGSVFILQRLMLEPRFRECMLEAPAPLDPLLHLAVSGDHFAIVDLLIEAGAGLSATDREGRTPLMVSESISMMKLLVQKHEADTTHTDNLGRNIWHLAGGSNDAELMKWLCLNDPSAAENMYVTSLEGNTPLAEAMLYINRLAEEAPFAVRPQLRHPAAAMAFFHHCKGEIDDRCFWSKVPVTHVAAEWGYLALINCLAKAGADFTQLNKHRQSVLYRIPLSATPTIVSRLMELCGESSPIADTSSHTPAESILHHIKFFVDEDSDDIWDSLGPLPSAHPSCAKELSRPAYELLLTPETLAWQDSRGRGLWERFCADVLMKYPIPPRESLFTPWVFLYGSIETALQCLVERNVAGDYEQRTGRAAISCFDSRRMIMRFETSDESVEIASDETGIMGALGPMFMPQGDKRWWNVKYLAPYILIILKSMPAVHPFYSTQGAKDLWAEAVEGKCYQVLDWMEDKVEVTDESVTSHSERAQDADAL